MGLKPYRPSDPWSTFPHGTVNAYSNYGCRCVECKRAKNDEVRQRRYGLDPEQYDAILLKQGGVCAICKEPEKRLTVDHSHLTGEVRGLLCDRCNGLVGYLETGLIESAIEYLGLQATGIIGKIGKAREN